MKKLFSLLTLALLTMSAWAETTVTFDFTQGYENGTELTTLQKDGVTLTFDKGTNNNPTKWYENGASARMYGGNTLNIASSGDNITKVTFTFTGTGNTMNNNGTCSVDAGTYVESGTTGTWTGNVDNFTITRGGTSGHARITSIEVVMGGEVVTIVADPVFTPADGATFTDTQEISLTCTTGGATISYSTDGLAWTTYTEPFTINETTKVYAKAALNGVESNVVTATYTKVDAPVGGDDVTVDFSAQGYVNAQDFDGQTVTINGISVSFSKGTGGTTPKYYTSGTAMRLYTNNTMTVTAPAGKVITSIAFTYDSGSWDTTSPSVGTYSTTDAAWIGNAASIVFTNNKSSQVRIVKMVVTLADASDPTPTVAAPTFDPEGQNFDESITVTINAEEGANIKYSTDEKVTWNDYTTPLNITETTTVYAKAVKGEKESTVVSATYTKNEPAQEITTLAQVNALGNNAEFTFQGNAVVTVQKNGYLWLRDASGYGLIYGSINGATDVTFPVGTVLNPGWTAKTKIYSGLMEYVNSDNVSASGNTNPELAAIQTITELDTTMVNAYVQVLNVKSFDISGQNVTATLTDGTTMVMYNTFNESLPTTEGNFTVEGVVSTHNGLQLIIISVKGYVPEEHNVYSIPEAIAVGPNVTFTMCDDNVVTFNHASSKRMWIRDTQGNSGLIYGVQNNDIVNGTVLSDGWTGKNYTRFGVPQFQNTEDVVASGDTREAAPFERQSIDSTNVNEYVIFKGINMLRDASEAKRFYNAADSTVLYNTFGITVPTIEEGKTYDVTGVVTLYNNVAQLYITEVVEAAAPAGLRGDVNNDTFVNISDVTVLIDYLLNPATVINEANANVNLDQDINISDVTTLIDFLLSGTWPNK